MRRCRGSAAGSGTARGRSSNRPRRRPGGSAGLRPGLLGREAPAEHAGGGTLHSSTVRASVTPPALPRPPACTCALTTQSRRKPAGRIGSLLGVAATWPAGRGSVAAKSCLDWYSWRFMGSPCASRDSRRGSLPHMTAFPARRRGTTGRLGMSNALNARARPDTVGNVPVPSRPPTPRSRATSPGGHRLLNIYRLLVPMVLILLLSSTRRTAASAPCCRGCSSASRSRTSRSAWSASSRSSALAVGAVDGDVPARGRRRRDPAADPRERRRGQRLANLLFLRGRDGRVVQPRLALLATAVITLGCCSRPSCRRSRGPPAAPPS